MGLKTKGTRVTIEAMRGHSNLSRLDDEKPDNKETNTPLERDLLEARTVLVSGSIDDKLCASVVARLLILENRDPDAPVTVYINSPGGSADSGFAMYDMLRFIKCPIRTVVNGLCASAAVLVFLAADEGGRLTLPGSRFLLHQPSTMGHGTASDLRITSEQIVKLRESYNQIVADATGRPLEKVLDDVSRDFWLSASEALEYGLANKIIVRHAEL